MCVPRWGWRVGLISGLVSTTLSWSLFGLRGFCVHPLAKALKHTPWLGNSCAHLADPNMHTHALCVRAVDKKEGRTYFTLRAVGHLTFSPVLPVSPPELPQPMVVGLFYFYFSPILSHFYSPLSPHGMRPIPRHPSVPCCLRKSPIDGPGLGGPARHTKKDKSKQFARLEVVGLFLQGEISPPQLQNGAFPPSAEIFRRAVALRGRYPRGHAPCPALSTRQASAAPTIPRV